MKSFSTACPVDFWFLKMEDLTSFREMVMRSKDQGKAWSWVKVSSQHGNPLDFMLIKKNISNSAQLGKNVCNYWWDEREQLHIVPEEVQDIRNNSFSERMVRCCNGLPREGGEFPMQVFKKHLDMVPQDMV